MAHDFADRPAQRFLNGGYAVPLERFGAGVAFKGDLLLPTMITRAAV